LLTAQVRKKRKRKKERKKEKKRIIIRAGKMKKILYLPSLNIRNMLSKDFFGG
jgi:hypothetical protein